MSRLGRKLIRGLREAADTYGRKRPKMPWYKAAWESIYLSDAYDVIVEPFSKVRRFFQRCIKVIQFLPVVWRHQDWDYGYIFEFNQFLHKRLYKGLYVDGHHVIRKQDQRALLAVIELYKRLHDEDLIGPHTDHFNKRWGKDKDPIFNFKKVTDISGRTYTTFHDPVKDRSTPEEMVQYNKERKALYKFEEYRYKQHIELLNKLITKHQKRWWD